MTTSLQLSLVKARGEDREWYPTTDEILQRLVRDLPEPTFRGREDRSFLDIGAGNGKVLDAVKGKVGQGKLYAVEISGTLRGFLDPDVFILGVDFNDVSLVGKGIGVVFCNPPYSVFVAWVLKILKEVDAGTTVYLVIPERWENNKDIAAALTARGVTEKDISRLGSYSFEKAEDRRARANVHLLRIRVPESRSRGAKDPFDIFFEETFTYPDTDADPCAPPKEEFEDLVKRTNMIEALVRLHDMRMEELQRHYTSVCALPRDLLVEFGITKSHLIESLRLKIAACKKEYWGRLFDGMEEITLRLTRKSREHMANRMQAATGIDFTRDNCYATVMWAVSNANRYFDQQLVDFYESMVQFANVETYASNTRIFEKCRFEYDFVRDEKNRDYRLKVGHRMVLHRCGGLAEIFWGHGNWKLDARGAGFVADMITVATNLGYKVLDAAPREGDWNDSIKKVIRCHGQDGKPVALAQIRVFQNSNMHVQFLPEFIHALNVGHGRLKGWLRNDAHASEELEIPAEVASRLWDSAFRLDAPKMRIVNREEGGVA
jgi:hypothetical protein